MNTAVLKSLEFDRVREILASDALTPLGRARALSLMPDSKLDAVQHQLDATGQAVAWLAAGERLSISAPEDLLGLLEQLRIDGQPLEAAGLISLAAFAESIDAVCGALTRADDTFRRLADVARSATSFASEAAATRQAIAPTGDVVDDASPALRDIRQGLRRQRARLRSTLEGLTRGRDTAKYLQDQIVTDRGGRYVLMVRAEHQSAVPGIVHGSSASGASLYLEPLATVQTNNEIVALAEREKAEVFRILLALTDGYRRRANDLNATLYAAGELDLLQAKARLAARLQGVAPRLTTDGRMELRGARHPLLDGSNVVGNDIVIVPPASALVISGPNTGGKTVALKAAGLLPLMAQAGLHIPVEADSALTPFQSVFADIGDDQSIAASLSTFSARIAHLVEMERALELPALVLLDEVGGGTDPIEGGALGTAVIDHFRQRGATVVATTHDDALKSYAATTDGISAAAMGFVPGTYAPTYRLVYGAPGRSLALEIAERLGMPASVITAARNRRSDRESQLAAHLDRVDQEIAALERERQSVTVERQALGEQRRTMATRESHVTEREAVLRRRLDDRVNERLREARAEIDRVVAHVKTKADELSRHDGTQTSPGRLVVSTGDLGHLRTGGHRALDNIAGSIDASQDSTNVADATLRQPPGIGTRVFVAAFGAEGTVSGVSGKHAEVDLRGKRMRIPWRDLRPSAAATSSPASPPPKGGGVSAPTPAGLVGTVQELMVIGKRVDQAIEEAEKFLDTALLTDARRLRVVHGHGTGRLRKAMGQFFREHPLVTSVAPAPDHEGGNGATIVELKD